VNALPRVEPTVHAGGLSFNLKLRTNPVDSECQQYASRKNTHAVLEKISNMQSLRWCLDLVLP